MKKILVLLIYSLLLILQTINAQCQYVFTDFSNNEEWVNQLGTNGASSSLNYEYLTLPLTQGDTLIQLDYSISWKNHGWGNSSSASNAKINLYDNNTFVTTLVTIFENNSANAAIYHVYAGSISLNLPISAGYNVKVEINVPNWGLNTWESWINSANITTITNTPSPAVPTGLSCWQIPIFNPATCVWDVTGTQPIQPAEVDCWDNYVFNTTTCVWYNTGLQPSITTVIDTACGEYLFGVNLLDISGTYVDTFLAFNGCDSIVALQLTIFEDSSITYITACDSAQWNGIWHYNDTIVTTTGLTTTNSFGGAASDTNSSGKEGNIWYFGQNAGLDFNSGNPVALTDGQLNTDEGCATISDKNGDLLFYTDGIIVYNRNHTQMPNGFGLLGHPSSTQSSIIVRKPGSSTIYYIFTVDGATGNNGGLNYSEVDMLLDGGLGNINTNKNIPLIPFTCEKVTAIKHQNSSDFWIISVEKTTNFIYSFLLTSAGINMTPIITTAQSSVDGVGYLKGSPDGSRVVLINSLSSNNFELYNFDNATGNLTFQLQGPGNGAPYGVEFSPNSNLLYISEWVGGGLFQFDLLAGSNTSIINSALSIGASGGAGALQLAPDNKIYQSGEGNGFISVINNPNIVGLGSNFNLIGPSLVGASALMGLPNFYSSIFNSQSIGCDSVATAIIAINNSSSSIDMHVACDTFIWVNGVTYTASNNTDTVMYTNLSGCDSIVTLDLIINYSTSSSELIVACDSYTWSINGATYTSSGIYIDTNTNSSGCINIDSLVLTINNSSSYSMSATACDTYTWPLNGSTYDSSGTYTDVSTNAMGCTHIDVLDLAIGYSVNLDLIIDKTDIDCFGYNNGSISLNINGGNPPYHVLWSSGSVSQTIISLSAGNYSFSVTDSNGCRLDSFAIINEANEISLDFIAISPICRYDESILSIDISNSTYNTYTILLEDSILNSFVIDTNGLLIPEGTPIILSPNFSREVYIVSLTDDEGCTQYFNDDVHIEVKQLPQLTLDDIDVCKGEPSFLLNSATPIGGVYFIDNEENDYFDVENLQIGSHNIRYEYTDASTFPFCSNEIEKIITINAPPDADFLFSPQHTDINDPNILFRDNSSNDIFNAVWDLGDSTIIYDELSFWHTYSDIGTYTIKYYVTNQNNCIDSAIHNLTINPVYRTYIPSSFTPNNDNINDYFYPSITGVNNYNMKIYDRWGGIIYNEDNGSWDGKINNNLIANGVYAYCITVLDFKDKPFIYRGLITIY